MEGPSGIGKTALAAPWGHQHQGWWPDGALYTDLIHTSPEAALRGWLLTHRHIALGRPRGAVLQTRHLAEVTAEQGRLPQAVDLWVDAHNALLDLEEPDLYQAGRALQGMTHAVIEAEVIDPVTLALVEMLCHQGLTSARTVGSIHQEAGYYSTLADLTRVREDHHREREELDKALALLEPTGTTVALPV